MMLEPTALKCEYADIGTPADPRLALAGSVLLTSHGAGQGAARQEVIKMTAKQNADAKLIDAWLQDKVLNRECPYCQSKKLKKGDDLVALAGLASNGVECSRPFVPVVPVYCEDCGLVLTFSLKAMGIVQPY